METNLTTKQESGLADPNLVREARSLTGEGGGIRIPFIPIIRVNNKKVKEKAIIGGKETEVEILPDASFTVTRKDNNSGAYSSNKFCEAPIEATPLRIRYRIQEKFDQKNPTKRLFYSYEFDMIQPLIQVFDGASGKVIAEGNYKDLKAKFKTGESDEGFDQKSFDLMMVMYIDLEGEVYRLERKVTMNDEWYKYSNTFGTNDTFVAYKTRFNLEKEKVGTNEFWKLSFERAEKVDLKKELELQKEINKFFDITQYVRAGKSLPPMSQTEEIPVIQIEEELNPTAPDPSEVLDSSGVAIPF
jgi:hypothetical protein